MEFLRTLILFYKIIKCSFEHSFLNLDFDNRKKIIFEYYSFIQIKNNHIKEIFEMHDKYYESKCKNLKSIMTRSYFENYLNNTYRCTYRNHAAGIISCDKEKLIIFMQENSKYLFKENLTMEDYEVIVKEISPILNSISKIVGKEKANLQFYYHFFTIIVILPMKKTLKIL